MIQMVFITTLMCFLKNGMTAPAQRLDIASIGVEFQPVQKEVFAPSAHTVHVMSLCWCCHVFIAVFLRTHMGSSKGGKNRGGRRGGSTQREGDPPSGW